MKKRLFRTLLLLPFIILVLSACNNAISNEAIKNAVNNEENCLKGCDQMEDKAMAEYEQCKREALDWLINALGNCNAIPCRDAAIETYKLMLEKCDQAYKKKLVEVRQCRKDCWAKFPLELKLK